MVEIFNICVFFYLSQQTICHTSDQTASCPVVDTTRIAASEIAGFYGLL